MLECVNCCEKNTKTKEREFKKAEQRIIKNAFIQFIHSFTHLATQPTVLKHLLCPQYSEYKDELHVALLSQANTHEQQNSQVVVCKFSNKNWDGVLWGLSIIASNSGKASEISTICIRSQELGKIKSVQRRERTFQATRTTNASAWRYTRAQQFKER